MHLRPCEHRVRFPGERWPCSSRPGRRAQGFRLSWFGRRPAAFGHGDGNASPANEPRQRDRSWLPFGLSRLGRQRNAFSARGSGSRARPCDRRRGGAGLSPRRRARKTADAHGGVGAFPRAEHSRQCREPSGGRIVLHGVPKPSATRGAGSPQRTLATFRRPIETASESAAAVA